MTNNEMVIKKKSKHTPLKRKENLMALAFISVKYVGLILFTFVPVLFTILYSFTIYNPRIDTKSFFSIIGDIWCGFDNYVKVFKSGTNIADNFTNAITNNLIFMLSVPLGIFIGLIVAVMLSNEKKIHGSRVIRTLIYVPVVSSAVAMNIIWRYIFNTRTFGGVLNVVMNADIPWLTDDAWIKLAIIIKSAWGSIGRTMILCLAALTNVGRDYREAAELDGASEITMFFKIYLPLISPTLFYLVCTGLIGNLQSYVDAQIFAEGRFGARTIVYFIWSYGINQSNYGVAGAASVILTAGIMGLTVLQFKISNKWVYSE